MDKQRCTFVAIRLDKPPTAPYLIIESHESFLSSWQCLHGAVQQGRVETARLQRRTLKAHKRLGALREIDGAGAAGATRGQTKVGFSGRARHADVGRAGQVR